MANHEEMKKHVMKKAMESATKAVEGAFENPEFLVAGADGEQNMDDLVGGSMAETVIGAVASGVASGVAGAIVADMIPGPAIPG